MFCFDTRSHAVDVGLELLIFHLLSAGITSMSPSTPSILKYYSKDKYALPGPAYVKDPVPPIYRQGPS